MTYFMNIWYMEWILKQIDKTAKQICLKLACHVYQRQLVSNIQGSLGIHLPLDVSLS